MVPWLLKNDPFPPVNQALGDNAAAPGLLAASRTLTAKRLLDAYSLGIFPWYSEGQAVLWWSPNPRMVLAPSAFKVAKSLRKCIERFIRDPECEIRINHNFIETMHACAYTKRRDQHGTWITPEVITAYHTLHTKGLAHSVEVWRTHTRIGGLYGICMGGMFFGESMFSHETNSSKLALAALCAFLRQHGIKLIDCQQETAHLTSLGGTPIPRPLFMAHLRQALKQMPIANWNFDKTILQTWIP